MFTLVNAHFCQFLRVQVVLIKYAKHLPTFDFGRIMVPGHATQKECCQNAYDYLMSSNQLINSAFPMFSLR